MSISVSIGATLRGEWALRLQFDYDDGGPGNGGKGTLFVNDEKVAERHIAHTRAGIFSADETADVGIDLGTPVVEAIGAEAKSRFTGKIPSVTVEVKEMKKAEKAQEIDARQQLARKKAASD